MKKKLIYVLVLLCLIPIKIKANTLECPSLGTYDKEIDCKIMIENVNGISLNYYLDQGLNYVDILPNTEFKTYYKNKFGLAVGSTLENNFNGILRLSISNNIELNKDYNIKLNNIYTSNDEYILSSLSDLSAKIRVVSNNNYLKNLEIEDVLLDKKFVSTISSYYAKTKKDTIKINTSLEDNDSSVNIIGNTNLSYGDNLFVIRVTSPYKEVRDYYLYVTKEYEIKDVDLTLKEIKLSSGKIKLINNQYTYNIDVDYDVDKIDIEAIPNDMSNTITIDKSDKLVLGENRITILVKSSTGEECKYILIINRNNNLSKDNTINSLKIENYDIDFKSDKYDYSLRINDEDKLNISVILNDDKASYKIINNDNLVNNSVIKIEVTNELNETLTYSITISKKDYNYIYLIVISCLTVVSISGIIKLVKHLIKFIKNNK